MEALVEFLGTARPTRARELEGLQDRRDSCRMRDRWRFSGPCRRGAVVAEDQERSLAHQVPEGDPEVQREP